MATHSKCFLIFSDSAYLEIPLMKRVRFTWGERGAGLPSGEEARECQEGVGNRELNGWEEALGMGRVPGKAGRVHLTEIRQ